MSSGSQPPALIMFVDDNSALLRSVERLLRMEGFHVMLAMDGAEALQRLEAGPSLPDLIISDIAMPRMDGFEFFEAIRTHEEWLDIPFLFLTARDQIEDLRRGYSLGADDYLVKPLDQERLLLVVRSKLKRRSELMEHIQVQKLALDTAKTNLALMVAHELRTPLVSISMVADILTREMTQMDPAQVRDMLATMQSGSVRLSRLVEQMVMYVQLQSGALAEAVHKHLRPTGVRDTIVGSIKRAQRYDYRQRRIPIQFDDYASDVQVSGDINSLQHALSEVVMNAIMFSNPDGTIVVTDWAADGLVWTTITDDGPGIPPDELPRVFDPFYQVNRQRHEQQGIGLGLTLAKGIIEAHQGSVEVQSRLGHGTLVTVALPLS